MIGEKTSQSGDLQVSTLDAKSVEGYIRLDEIYR